jgi:uncharacterized protein YjbJ (UPF0337 family)
MVSRTSAKVTELKGKTKEVAGKATGDRSLEAEGKGDQLKGQAKQAAADIKKVAGKAKRTVTR